MPRKVDRFNVDGEDYVIEPILDPAPVEGSVHGVESGGVYSAMKQDKTSVPMFGDNRNFTANGAAKLRAGTSSGLYWLPLSSYEAYNAAFGNNTIVQGVSYPYSIWVVYSEDDGATWNNATVNDPPPANSYFLGFKHSENGHIVGIAFNRSNDGKIYYSDDDGRTFNKASIPVSIASGDYFDGLEYFKGVWICSSSDSSTTLYSTDNGQTWQLSAEYANVNGFSDKSPTAIISSNAKRSTDGINWTQVGTLTLCKPSYCDGVWMLSDSAGLYRSNDDGATVTLVVGAGGSSFGRAAYFNGFWFVTRYVSNTSKSYMIVFNDKFSSWSQVNSLELPDTFTVDLYNIDNILFSNLATSHIRRSLDGMNWSNTTLSSLGTGGYGFIGIRYKDGKLMVSEDQVTYNRPVYITHL